MKTIKDILFSRKIFKSFLLAFMVALSFSLVACDSNKDENNTSDGKTEKEASSHEPITQELITILDEDPEVKALLEKSIDKAKEINPDKTTNPAQSLEEYYEYIDWAAKAMPWNISQNLSYSGLYEQIDQSLNYFYFINDQPLEELEGQGLYNNSLQYAEPYRSWLIKFTKEWGEYLSTEESWSEDYYKLAYEDERFGLQEEWYEDPSNWSTFNEFFSRRLSSPDQRPITAPDDPSVVVSPADSTPQGLWQIDENSNIIQKEGAEIKSQTFNSIIDLIGQDSEYKESFANGIMTHTFLDVHDYHRYHFPLGGEIKEVRIIPQDDAVGGYVEWDANDKKYVLNAEVPGWQMIETRACVILETPDYGLVALMPIGMSQVSSVNFEENIKVGTQVEKGDMLGYFLFGGSDFIMIFQEQAGFEMTANTDDGGDVYTHLLMGQEYGRLEGQQ